MTTPFDDLTKAQITKLIDLLAVHIYRFNKNQEVLPTIKNENIIGIILQGFCQIIYNDYNGNEIILENIPKNNILGSNFSAINDENCQIIAKEYTEIMVIDYDRLIMPQNLNHNYFNIFFRNLFDIINTKFKERTERMRILEKKQIRDKLLDYFEIEYKRSGSRHINLPFSFKDFADYIAVNRSAMFRELKNLKEEKFIEINNRKITLLYKNRVF